MKKAMTSLLKSVIPVKLASVFVWLGLLGLTMPYAVHATPPSDAVWNMTFNDEFDGTNLDLGKWDPIDICCGVTDHQEYYLPQNNVVSNGILTQVFKNDGYGGKPYTSGAITSYYKQQYGYFEIRCQLPPGDGMWPAFWALQATNGSFAGNGWEIDIMEGLGSMPNWIDSNVGHWVNGSASWSGCQYGSPYPPLNFQTGYHTFGWEWRTNNDFLFYVDDVLYCEETVAEGASIPALAVCANLQGAISGGPDGYTPNVDGTTPFPSYYNIDYIRIYQYGTATNPPATPTNVTATAGSGQVTLSWTASSGASSYNVKRSTVSGGSYSTIASPTTASYTDIAVTGGTNYYYVVSAVNSVGESTNSIEVSATPSAGAPATAIENFDGYANGSSIGSGTMNGGAGWTGVWQSNHTGTQSVTNGVLNCTGTSLGDWRYFTSPVSIAANTTYYFRADLGLNEPDQMGFWGFALTDGSGVNIAEMALSHNYFTSFVSGSQFSGSAPGYTPDGTVKHLIGQLQWNGSSLTLSVWVVPGNGNIPTSQSAAGSATWVQTGTAPAATKIGGVLLETYGMTGIATADNLYFGPTWASVISGTASPPAAPTNVVATAGNGQVTLSWNSSSGATSYNVKRATTSGNETTIANPTATGYTDTSVTNETTYYYVVTAVNGNGESGDSSEVSAIPTANLPPATPANLTATPGNGQVVLNWSASTGATSYNVMRATTSGNETIVSSPTTTNYTDTDVTNGTTYYYVVTAVNGHGASGNSSEVNATPSVPTAVDAFSEYANGTSITSMNGGIGWSGAWQSNGVGTQVASNGSLLCTGNGLSLFRPFSSPVAITANTTFYFRADLGVNEGAAGQFWGVLLTDNAKHTIAQVAEQHSSVVSYINQTQSGSSASYTPDGNVQHLICEVQWSGSSINLSVWVIPGGSSIPATQAAAGSPSFTQSGSAPTANNIGGAGLNSFAMMGTATANNLYYGSTWADVIGSGGGGGGSAPATPANLTATAGDGQVALSWNASTGATSYNVKRGTASGSETTIASPTGTSYNDTNVINGTTYYYVVTAINGSGESGYSNEVSATPQAGSSPTITGGIISFNVCSPQNTNQDFLLGGDYAGAPGARTNNWNNLVASGNWSSGDIILSSGTVINSAGSIVSGLSATFHPANGGGVGTYSGGGNTNDTKMFVDYNDTFDCSGFSQYGYLDVTGIPFAKYKIYCYAATDNSPGGTGSARGGFFVVTNAPGGAMRCYIKDVDNNGNIVPEPDSSGNGYVQSTTTSIPSGGTSFANINGGNYVVFDATLTNATARVWFGALGGGQGVDDLGNTVTDGDGAARLKVSGFQIVQVVTSDPVLAAQRNGDHVILNWTGTGFKLQTTSTLSPPAWTDYALPDGTNPPVSVLIAPGNAAAFFRLSSQ